MKYPKLREIKGALKSFFTKPYTTKFPKVPFVPFSSFRGRPYYYEDKCIGCTACVNVCPTKALTFKDVVTGNTAKRILTINWDICIACGQCELNCVSIEGIMLSNEFDIATTEHRSTLRQTIEKEMIFCEHCNSAFACRDHLSWTIEKLGPLYPPNTTLLAFNQNALSINAEIPEKEGPIGRADRFSVLCPKCRREAVFTS
jgi:formate hydrogenlyase subunit 6/NADH:ubiquinone oxidoreductase subunit I